MKQPQGHQGSLTRRHWIVLAASAVSAGCGGGSATTAGLPGTGGTGLFAQGTISGFGSVIINAIRFDDSAATVTLDGQSASAADLRLGMVAAVQAERGADLTQGKASSIEVWSVAQGLVSAGQATPGASGQFTVSSMTVLTDANTIFDGISAALPLRSGQRVAVWGLQAGSDGRSWSATRVAVVSSAIVVSSGLVSVAGGPRSVNGLSLTGTVAATLTAGDLVRVQGSLSLTDGSLAVLSVRYPATAAAGAQQGEAEIEGLVTSTVSASRFSLGSVVVDASQAVWSPAGAQITQGARVQVDGIWQSGVLKASKVELEDAQSLEAVEISGVVQEFTSVGNFVVRSQRCDATGANLGPATLAGLKVGAKVQLKGVKAGDVLRVTELQLDN